VTTDPIASAADRIRAARNLAELAIVVRTAARKLMNADGVTFVLRDKDSCLYYDEDAIAPLWKGRRFPMSMCVSGWTMTRGAPAVIPDIYADARVPQDAYRTTFVKSLAMVPVGTTAPLAAIGVYWAASHTPSSDELAALSVLADAAVPVLADICPRCHERGFVRRERVVERGVASTHFVCAACEHRWQVEPVA
jgi:two-component system CheB/CheR fusion protein